MPFDSGGNYTLPIAYLATTGQTALATQHNTPLQDLAAAISHVLLRDGRAPMTGALNMNEHKITGLTAGSDPGDAVRFDQVPSAAQLAPPGSMVLYGGATPPSGWLLCFGQAVSRTGYATLFEAIGTAWGVGDGTTTFNLPDMRGYTPAGKDDMGGTAAGRLASPILDGITLGAVGGSQAHTLTAAQMPAHTHGGNTGSGGDHTHNVTYSRRTNSNGDLFAGSDPIMGAIGGGGLPTPTDGATSAAATHTHPITSAGGGEAHSSMQPTRVVNIIIRTGL